MNVTNIIMGMIILVLVSTGFLLFLVEGVKTYAPTVPSDYNKSFVHIQENMDDMSSIANESDSQIMSTVKSIPIVGDFLGFFFGQLYQGSKVMLKTLGLHGVIVNDAIESGLSHTGMGSTITNVAGLIILFTTLLFLLHFVIKSDRI